MTAPGWYARGPKGDPNELSIGTVTSGPTADATITGDAPSQTLDLVLPKGDKGDPNSLAIGDVTSGPSADASITGTPPSQTLDLVLPKGDQGEAGISITSGTGAPGSVQPEGTLYIDASTGKLYRRGASSWSQIGDLKGPQGDVTLSQLNNAVSQAIADLVDGSPSTLDTLNELAAALGNDPNFATTVSNQIGTKADKATKVTAGTGLTGGGDLSADRTLSVSFGTSSSTACAGNDSRLSNARTPTAHTHAASDITSGTLAIARIPTGTTSSTVCIGNDSRLSDARTPKAHTHDASDIVSGQLATARMPANYRAVVIGTSAPGDTSALWIDTN